MNYRKLAPGLKEFVKYNNISVMMQDGVEYLILYKAVRADYGSWNKSEKNKNTRGAYKAGNEVHCYRYNTNRNSNCDEGLHVGTFIFAKEFTGYSKPILIEVLVKPEDIVCVPFGQFVKKIRCKKLLVNRIIARKTFNSWLYENTWKKYTNGKWGKPCCDFEIILPTKYVEI